MEYKKEEIIQITIAIVIAALIFSFTEWGATKFNINTGLLNFTRALLISIPIFFLRSLSQKYLAKKYDSSVEFTLPSMDSVKNTIRYFGPIITIFVTLITNGKFFLPLLSSFNLKTNRTLRVGRKWANIREFEIAKIGLAGILSDIFLLTIFRLALPFSEFFFSKAIFIASSLAIFHLLPIPKLDGERIFFGSRPLYVTTLVFTITYIALIQIAPITFALLAAVVLGAVICFRYMYNSLS